MTTVTPDWLERLLARLPRRAVPPSLLTGYTQRVMARVRPAPSAVWWRRPAVRWAPALTVAGALLWVGVTMRPRLDRTVIAQAIVLDRLNEPWGAEAIDEETLVEEAHQVDRFVLTEAHAASVSHAAESLLELLDRLGEEAPDAASDEGWPDAADPEIVQHLQHQVYLT